MEKKTKLVILDEVNAKFHDLDPGTRRKLVEATKFFIPYARHMPAFRLGRWDGTVSFTTLGGMTHVNLLEKLLPIVIEAGYEIEIEDQRVQHEFEFPLVTEDYFVDNMENPVWPPKHPAEGQLIKLRDYQVDVIRNYLDNLQCLQEVATGAGKTLMTATLSHLIEPYGRSIVIVPNKSLVEQTEADYKNIGLDVGVFYGDRKEYNKKHTICTWQSLAVLAKKSKKEDEDFINDFLEDVIAVIVDETHSAKANELRDLLTGPMSSIPIRWGLTGTVPKEDFEYYAIYSSIGPVVNRLAASQLQDMGVLAQCHVQVMQTLDTAEYSTYHDEYKFLVEDKERVEWLGNFIKNTATTGNTLVLCDRITTGQMLNDMIPGSVFINGSTKSKQRKEQYDDIQDNDNKVLIATYGVAAVGINIPRIFNLVLIEPGKSFVRVIQSIGRGIRKAKDKDFVQIFDVCSTCKFSARQLTARKKTYKEASYPFDIQKVKYK